MSQTFHGAFVPTDDVQTTMVGVINESLDALRTKFSGPTVPGTPSAYQWWMDTTTDILKIYDGSVWLNVYDVGNQELVLAVGQVDAVSIADAARKPSLIEGEDIGPSTCSLRAPHLYSALPWIPQEVFSEVVVAGGNLGVLSVGTPTWEALLTHYLWVPTDAQTLYLMATLTTCNLSFVLNGVRSSISTATTGLSDEVSLDVSSLAGNYTFTVEGRSTQGGAPFGGIGSVVARWNV